MNDFTMKDSKPIDNTLHTMPNGLMMSIPTLWDMFCDCNNENAELKRLMKLMYAIDSGFQSVRFLVGHYLGGPEKAAIEKIVGEEG